MLRRFASLAAVAAIACSSPGESNPEGSAKPAERQEIVVAVGADEFGLKLNRPRLGRYPLNAEICETLVHMTSDFQLAPSLATRWEYMGDNTYRFWLRRGVKFHGGSEFGASDVRYTMQRSVEEKTQYSFLSETSVHIVDDSTVDIRPTIPNLRLLEQLSHPTYGVIANGSNSTAKPDCTGPFRLYEYVPGQYLSVIRNDSYYGGRALLSRITFRFIPDDNTRALSLRAGEVDVIFDVNRGMVGVLKATPGINIATARPGAVVLMYIATKGTPPHTVLGDPAVRRAVAMAIDRKSLVESVMDGYAAVVNTLNPPAVLGPHASAVRGISFDVAGSERILDSIGWRRNGGGTRLKEGRRLVLTMITQPNSVDRATSQYVQAQLARVGIETKIDELDAAAFESRLNSGAFDLDIEIPNQNDANPAFLLALRWYSKSNVRSSGYMLAGPRFDSLVSESLASTDHDIAQEKAAQAMHVLVDEEVAAIPLAGLYRIYAMKSSVNGFDPHPSRINQSWTKIWMAAH